ncbi:MAG TPA: helix-hairpin-helix domain-containing protein [Castellaniella sp.]|uniref:ComEA family DNA-binding protein n=1 Tax=Castellaniella sp. TaxID=1955812 RepID=UPI002EFCE2A2
MNPFLHQTVALPRRSGWPHVLRVAGLAALAWAGTAGAVDLNTATLEQLRSVRGIGPKTAQIILQERDRGGRYISFSDLSDRVRGIGPKRAQGLQAAGLTVDGGGLRVSGQGESARQGPPGARPSPAPVAPRPARR